MRLHRLHVQSIIGLHVHRSRCELHMNPIIDITFDIRGLHVEPIIYQIVDLRGLHMDSKSNGHVAN